MEVTQSQRERPAVTPSLLACDGHIQRIADLGHIRDVGLRVQARRADAEHRPGYRVKHRAATGPAVDVDRRLEARPREGAVVPPFPEMIFDLALIEVGRNSTRVLVARFTIRESG
jgi:hypothetical protein